MLSNTRCCEITHAQIVFGVCPWCDVILGKVRSTVPLRKSQTHWFPAALAEGIRSDDTEVRETSVSGLRGGWQLDEEMLGVLATALEHSDHSLVESAERALQMRANRLPDVDVQMLERICEAGRHELPARIMLLASCGVMPSKQSQIRHALWMIEHFPQSSTVSLFGRILPFEDEAAFSVAKRMWQEHLAAHSHDPRILKNAALFLFIDEPETALRLLRQAFEIHPDSDAKWLLCTLEEIGKRGPAASDLDYWKNWKRDF